jgi:hypothetical protein
MRAIASMPPAAPARLSGPAVISVALLGVWKKPKPTPHKAMRQTMSTTDGAAGIVARQARPAASAASPRLPSSAAGYFAVRRPAIGAAKITSSGHGVTSSPVSTAERCCADWNRNGSET